MKRTLLTLLLLATTPMALAGCALDSGTAASAPAPLTHTTIDEKALTLASQTVDTLAISASALVKVGALKGGTPAALALADALDAARDGVNAAAAAREAGNATDYTTAISKALAAVAQAREVLKTGD